jgi:hypothetical protein
MKFAKIESDAELRKEACGGIVQAAAELERFGASHLDVSASEEEILKWAENYCKSNPRYVEDCERLIKGENVEPELPELGE